MRSMALTHDGLSEPLPPSRLWQLIGLLITAGGVALLWIGWYCTGVSVLLLGLLTFGNQLGGVTRVRVTFSKLLLEHERPVVGFLIGPVKQRIPWDEFQTVDVAGGKVVAKGRSTTLELGAGRPESELEELSRKIRDAAERWRTEAAERGGT
jgi:hypothetical protein